MRTLRPILILGFIATLASATMADVEEGQGVEPFSDTLQYRVGGYLVDFSTDIAAGRNVLGATIRAESQIGLDENVSNLFFDGFLRLKPKHAIGLQVFSAERDGDTVVKGDFEWDNVRYLAGARVISELDIGLVKLAYRYSFVNNGKTEAGFLAGLSFYRFNVAVAGQGAFIADDGSIGEIGFARGQQDLIAPIPTIGMFIRHAITPRLIFGISAESLDLDIGDFEGRIVDSRVTFDWFITKDVGIGAGTATTDIRFADLSSETQFSIDYKQDGFLVYAIVSF